MRSQEDGPALVLVYGNGALVAKMLHTHDGGEVYMRPLIRRGIQYAKTHYDSGDIVEVLLTEPEMRMAEDNEIYDAGVRHIYYITYRYIASSARKVYKSHVIHLTGTDALKDSHLCLFAANIPTCAREMT